MGLEGGNTALGCLTIAGIELDPTVIKDAEGRITNISYAAENAPTGGARFKKADSAAEYGYATALGFGTAAGATGAIATGWYSVAGNSFAFAGGEGSIAYGRNSIAYGERVIAAGTNSLAIGYGGSTNSMGELDSELIASGNNSVALGNSTKALGANSVALNLNTEAEGENSFAAGSFSKATGRTSFVAGEESEAQAENSTALSGGIVTVSATNSAAIGKGATANAANSMAIGKNAITNVAGTVALGSNSVADRRAGEKLGYDPVSKAAFASETAIAAALGKTAELADINTRLAPKQAAYDTAYNNYLAAENAFNTAVAADQAASAAYDANPTQENKQAKDAAAAAYTDAYIKYYFKAIPAVNAAAAELKPVVQEKNMLLAPFKSSAGAIAVGDASKGVSRQITGVAAGTEDTDAVNVAQLKAVSRLASSVAGEAVKHTAVKAGTNVTVDEAKDADGSTVFTVSVKADGQVAPGNTGIVSGNTVYNETRVSGDGTYVKKDNTAGANISALDRQVKTNAGNIQKNTESINNLNTTINNMGNQVGKLGDRINRAGAGAAALAALHPLDFDAEDKWDISAGYGNYNGANAAALGAFYRPNEDTMVSVGASIGGGENMVNAGVSVKLGQGNHVSTSKVEMAREIKELQAEVEMLKQAILDMRKEKDEGQAEKK